MPRTKPRALLITGSELRFEKAADVFATYLQSVGAETQFLRYASANKILSTIEQTLRNTPVKATVMICFIGHGHEYGWEATGWLGVSYRRIIKICKKFPHRILFVNDTCYGQYLIKAMLGRRSGYYTSILCNWESFKTSCSGFTTDLIAAWELRKFPEQHIALMSYGGDDASGDFMIIQRWGAVLDTAFFPQTN
jgi:hypothetical protein